MNHKHCCPLAFTFALLAALALPFPAAAEEAAPLPRPAGWTALDTPLPPRDAPTSLTVWNPWDRSDRGTSATFSQFGEKPGPSSRRGSLSIAAGGRAHNLRNAVAFDQAGVGLYAGVDARFRLQTRSGSYGGSFILLSVEKYGAKGPAPDMPEWEEPNIPGSFAVGFDVDNPPTSNWFDGNGNFYDRPQREISLHWDGREIENVLSPVEFRADPDSEDERGADVQVLVRFIVGGARVTVSVNGKDVYRNYFIAGMRAYESRVALGARTGDRTADFAVRNLRVSYSEPVRLSPDPVRVRIVDGPVIYSKNEWPTALVNLPKPKVSFARVILTLSLEAPPGGFEGWDRKAGIYIWDDKKERYELMRFITPYGRGHVWKEDVTDFLPILRGKKKIAGYVGCPVAEMTPETQKGWKIVADLDYYPGKMALEPFAVRNLWVGEPEYGNPEKPIEDFFKARQESVPANASAVRLRIVTTGHGGGANTANAAEFMPAGRTVLVNGTGFANRLWKTDCYLNPCHPQGGTWKFDRAGWAPGDRVAPWEIDATPCVKPGETARIEYQAMKYLNENYTRGQASHWLESQIVFYRSGKRR